MWLVGLSAGSSLVALMLETGSPGRTAVAAAGATILGLGWLKARIILSRYLRLAEAPAILRGFELALALFVLLLAGLYLWGGAGG